MCTFYINIDNNNSIYEKVAKYNLNGYALIIQDSNKNKI